MGSVKIKLLFNPDGNVFMTIVGEDLKCKGSLKIRLLFRLDGNVFIAIQAMKLKMSVYNHLFRMMISYNRKQCFIAVFLH